MRTTYQNDTYLCTRNQKQQNSFMFIGFKNITTAELNNNQQQNNQNQNNQVPMVIPFDRSGM